MASQNINFPDLQLEMDVFEWTVPVDVIGPILVRVGGAFKFQGKAIYLFNKSEIQTTFTIKEGKLSFAAAVESDPGKLTVKYDANEPIPSKLSLSFSLRSDDYFEWQIKFEPSDILNVLQFRVKTEPIKGSIRFDGWNFRGQFDVEYLITLTANPGAVVWRALLKKGIDLLKLLVSKGRAGIVALHGAFVTEGIVKYTGLGSVAIPAAMAAAGIAWTGFVLYMLSESSKAGRNIGIADRFILGYAEMLYGLTQVEPHSDWFRSQTLFILGSVNPPIYPRSENYLYELLIFPWRQDFEPKAKRWIDKGDRKVLGWFNEAGRAALLQCWCDYEVLFGRKALDDLSHLHKEIWPRDRKDHYINFLRQQFKNDGEIIKKNSAFGISPFLITSQFRSGSF